MELETMGARGEMASEVGHELNNFLGVVTGAASLLDLKLKTNDLAGAKNNLAVMLTNLEKMRNFTEGLMRQSNLRAPENTVIDLGSALREIMEFLTPQKRFIGVSARVEIPSAVVPVAFDSLQFQQLMYNLINNAADATRGQAVRAVTVTLTIDKSALLTTVTVADTGVGMDQDTASRVFKSRFTSKQDGHGFGLVVCKRIIDAHHGAITIDSAPGAGARISIAFPLSNKRPASPLTSPVEKSVTPALIRA